MPSSQKSDVDLPSQSASVHSTQHSDAMATTHNEVQPTKEKATAVATSTSGDSSDENSIPEQEFLVWWKAGLVMIAMYLSAFLVALDRTILATAVPKITAQFNSLGDVGWYGSSYLLTSCSFQLLFGKFYTFYSPKWVFLVNVFLFTAGSAICGAAPNSTTLIIGRAVAGIGASGINAGLILIFARVVPPAWRPMCTGFLGAAFGLAAVLGPIIGGALAQYATWNWIFWINLPAGLFTTVVVALFLHMPAPKKLKGLSEHYDQFDLIGTFVFFPSVISLLLALQWGGTTFAWKSGQIIGLFVTAGVLFNIFVGVEIWQGDGAMVPPRVFKQRSILSGVFFSFCLGASLMTTVFYLPIWFQAIIGTSAFQSGLNNIPMLVALIVGSIGVRIGITGVGYYAPFMIASAAFMAIGSGLFTTLAGSTPTANWIGYQILYGFGVGLGLQQTTMCGLTVLDQNDTPIGVALMLFAQTLGGSVILSAGQNIFGRSLQTNLAPILGKDAPAILKAGATAFRKTVTDPEVLGQVIIAYGWALRSVFVIVVSVSCICALSSLGIGWEKVKHKVKVNDPEALIA